MSDQMAESNTPDYVSPPGDTLRDLLEEKGIRQSEVALRMGRPRKTISEIINGKAAITHDTALQLELVTGVAADFWSARERAYRAYLARLEEVERLESEYSWCRKFPLRDMTRLGWMQLRETKAEQVHELFSFLGVVSSSQWDELYAERAVAFRRPKAFAPNRFALGAWLRRGAAEARTVRARPFNRERFALVLEEARALTVEDPRVFVPALKDSCASAGVVVALVPALPRSRASGATRWLSADKALIQLSLRYRTNDHLWFTFFHEAAHILLHGKKDIFIEANGDRSGKEEEDANRWAADFLIPRDDYGRLLKMGLEGITEDLVRRFAAELGIAPGIVIGRLQHDGKLPHTHLNRLKVRYEWAREGDTEASSAAE